MSTQQIRLSYTLLELWRRGQINQALDMYFRRKKMPTTPQMLDGIRIHKSVQNYVLKNNRFPEQVTTIPVNNPEIEKEFIVEYSSQFLIKVKIDLFDTDSFFELKTGWSDSVRYAREYQVPMYFLVSDIAGFHKEKAYIIHYNQYTKEKDMTMIWHNKRQIELAKNYIDSIAPDLYNYFNNQSLW